MCGCDDSAFCGASFEFVGRSTNGHKTCVKVMLSNAE